MYKYFFIIFLSVIFLSGCVHDTGSLQKFIPGKKSGDVISRGFGLKIEFLQNQPPREIFLRPDFENSVPVTLRVTNFGPDSISGKIKVYNTLSDNYGGIDGSLESSFSIDAASEVEGNVQGFDQVINLGELSYNYEAFENRIQNNVQDTLVSEVLMGYDVDIAVPICVSDPTGNDCRNTEVLSGAALGKLASSVPVTVKSVSKSLTPTGSDVLVSLTIVLSNVGNGKIMSTDENIKNLLVTLENEEIKCYSTNTKYSLKRGNLEVRCDTRRNPTYETPLLQISYDYEYSIKSSMPVTLVVPENKI